MQFFLIFGLFFWFINILPGDKPITNKEWLEQLKKNKKAQQKFTGQEAQERLNEKFNVLLDKSNKSKDITVEIINLDNQLRKAVSTYSVYYYSYWQRLQKNVNFTGAYDIISQEQPNAAINIENFYKKTLRYNQEIKTGNHVQKSQDMLDFIFDKNKMVTKNIDFARTIEIMLLSGYFIRNTYQNSKSFLVVVAATNVFQNLSSDKEKNNFLSILGTVNKGEQFIAQTQHDIPLNFAFHERVRDYLNSLKNHNNNAVCLFEYYFLHYFFFPGVGLDIQDKPFHEIVHQYTNDSELMNSKENREIKDTVETWKAEFKSFSDNQFALRKKSEEENKKKEELTPWQKIKNKTKSPYFYIPVGLGLGALITYFIYQHWDYFKNLRGK